MLPYDVNTEEQLDQYPAAGRPAKTLEDVAMWKRLLWEGGRPFDAFLTIVSAQVAYPVYLGRHPPAPCMMRHGSAWTVLASCH